MTPRTFPLLFSNEWLERKIRDDPDLETEAGSMSAVLADIRARFAQSHYDFVQVGTLPMFTVYFNPPDHPGKYVVRMHVVEAGGSRPTNEGVVADDLETVRSVIPHGLTCMPRDPNDEKQIVEVWF